MRFNITGGSQVVVRIGSGSVSRQQKGASQWDGCHEPAREEVLTGSFMIAEPVIQTYKGEAITGNLGVKRRVGDPLTHEACLPWN